MTVESRLADVVNRLRNLGNAVRLQGRRMSAAAPSDLNFLGWNATTKKWEPKHPPKVFAYRTTTQVYTSGSADALRMGAELFDTDSMHEGVTNPSRVTFNTAGTYILAAHSSWSANPTNAIIKITKNGTDDLALAQIVGDYRSMGLSAIRDFVVGDYIEMILTQGSGTNKTTLISSGKFSTLSAVWVAR